MIGLHDRCTLSPSLICLNMCALGEQIADLEQAGIGVLHIDILDGHFSPSMPLGFETVSQIRKVTAMDFDCHVMTQNPEYSIGELLSIGVQQITFHLETASHVDGLLNLIRSHGVKAGVALKPSTPLSELDYILEKCDAVLLMLINPGYASSVGEKQVAYADRKVRELRDMIDSRGATARIEIDGRISRENIRDYGGSTVDSFVCGSTCLDKSNLKASASELVALRESILREE